MYIKSLIGAAAVAMIGSVIGAGTAAAAPAATITLSGNVVTAHVTGAVGYPLCTLDDNERASTNGTPNGAGNVTINLSLPDGDYLVNVVCGGGGTTAVRLVNMQSVSLPAPQTGGGGSLSTGSLGSS